MLVALRRGGRASPRIFHAFQRTVAPNTPLSRATSDPLLHIVLFEPQIPPNTGTIGRVALTSRCRLHLIDPHFSLEDKWLRRAGMDYWSLVDMKVHSSWDAYLADSAPERVWLFTTRGSTVFWDATFRRGDHILFGNENSGAPAWMHEWAAKRFGEAHRVRLPQSPETAGRSLNLACTVSCAVYEGLRQIGTKDGLPF